MKSYLNERFIGCPVIMTNFLCVEFKSFCACCWYLLLIDAENVFVTLSFISSHFYNTNHIQNTIIIVFEVWLPSAHTAAKRWFPSLQDDAAQRRWKRRQIDETRLGASPWSNRLSPCLYVLQALGNPTTPVCARYSSLGLNWGSSSWQFWDSSQRTTSLTLGPRSLSLSKSTTTFCDTFSLLCIGAFQKGQAFFLNSAILFNKVDQSIALELVRFFYSL